MAETKVVESNVPGNGHLPLSSDPVFDLMAAASSLKLLADHFDDQNNYGAANVIALHAAQISQIAERMDNENWSGGARHE